MPGHSGGGNQLSVRRVGQPLRHESHRRIRPRGRPASWGMATPIPPTFPSASAVPRCAWPRPEPSTGPCARLMASVSARSRRLDCSRGVRAGSGSSKMPPKNTHGANGSGNRNGSGHKVRDRLCQLIRQHKLDPELVKAYAVDFCGTKELKEATRE